MGEVASDSERGGDREKRCASGVYCNTPVHLTLEIPTIVFINLHA